VDERASDARKYFGDFVVVTTEKRRTMIYEVGDMVRIVDYPWNQHAGDVVIITKKEEIDGKAVYEWVIPEQRGSAPEHLIGYVIARGMNVAR
jgi:hypothetical protein